MAKKKTAKKRIFVLKNGDRYEITGETGKYWLCGPTQFRKLAERGRIVYEDVTPEPEPEVETESAEPVDGATVEEPALTEETEG